MRPITFGGRSVFLRFCCFGGMDVTERGADGCLQPNDIDSTHDRIRTGDFDGSLAVVLENKDAWLRSSDEAQRLKGIYVAAEVFDYFGCYAEAKEVLAAQKVWEK